VHTTLPTFVSLRPPSFCAYIVPTHICSSGYQQDNTLLRPFVPTDKGATSHIPFAVCIPTLNPTIPFSIAYSSLPLPSQHSDRPVAAFPSNLYQLFPTVNQTDTLAGPCRSNSRDPTIPSIMVHASQKILYQNQTHSRCQKNAHLYVAESIDGRCGASSHPSRRMPLSSPYTCHHQPCERPRNRTEAVSNKSQTHPRSCWTEAYRSRHIWAGPGHNLGEKRIARCIRRCDDGGRRWNDV
jgi:hypothetical protein